LNGNLRRNQRNKGFDKANRLFSYTGANNTRILEIWLLIYPQDDNKFLQVPVPTVPLPIIERRMDRPAPDSKYFAIFVRELNPAYEIHHVHDTERSFLVDYYVIEPNMSFRVPVCSLLAGAPDINTNVSLDAMGYEVQIQTI
jgi:hypothetical protein